MQIIISIPTDSVNPKRFTGLREGYQIIFICFICLGLFYPSLFGPINLVDDSEMVANLMNIDEIDWKALFLPGESLKYYRPVLYLTFIMDRFLWLCDESFMHLENILFHTINAILFFFIMKTLIKRANIKTEPYVPMIGALLFGITPLNTEAVNWISCRTDLMAGTFVFLSLLLFLSKGIERPQWGWLSGLFYLLGLLSKEVALGLLPAIMLFLYLEEEGIKEIVRGRRMRLLLPYISATIIYLLLRLSASSFKDMGGQTILEASQEGNLLIKLGGLIKAFGFYIKKLFVPLPLNFAIVEINRTLYFWFGLAILLLSIYIISKKRNSNSFLYFFSVFFFLPALPVAVSKMAWTPLAERYLYISSAGVLSMTVLVMSKLISRRWIFYGLSFIFVIVSIMVTLQRNIIWQDNLTLFEDTVKKSPRFPAIRNLYGIALAKAGRNNEALTQFKIASELGGKGYWYARLNIIEHNTMGKAKLTDTRLAYENLLKEQGMPEDIILGRMVAIIESELTNEKDYDRARKLIRDEINYLERLTKIKKNAYYFYRLGQLYLTTGNKKGAKDCFEEVIRSQPKAYFASAAKSLLEKIEKDLSF